MQFGASIALGLSTPHVRKSGQAGVGHEGVLRVRPWLRPLLHQAPMNAAQPFIDLEPMPMDSSDFGVVTIQPTTLTGVG